MAIMKTADRNFLGHVGKNASHGYPVKDVSTKEPEEHEEAEHGIAEGRETGVIEALGKLVGY
jgi:hypothetical protein